MKKSPLATIILIGFAGCIIAIAGLWGVAKLTEAQARIDEAQPAIIDAQSRADVAKSEYEQDAADAQFFRDAAWWAILSPWLTASTALIGYFVTNVQIKKISVEVGGIKTKVRATMRGWGK